ncbi:hypothetical protein D3C72_1306670 [compost metagenome]
MVLVDDAVGDRQAQAGTAAHRLGGEERIEDALAQFRRNATAGVFELDPHRVAVHAGAHGDRAALGDGMAGVEQQVHVDLVQLRGQAFHQRQLAELAHQVHLVLELVPDDVDGRFKAGMQVDQLPRLIAAGIGEVLQVAHDAGDALDAFA